MDGTDADIRFDSTGVCNHCLQYDAHVAPVIARANTELGRVMLERELDRIRRDGAGSGYDCLIGMSGGVDSTYVALLCRELGLRPLAVHFDSGWNTETAVANIEAALTKLKLDLVTEVAEWDEIRDLQLAFLRAALPNCDIPQDHGIVATMFRTAERFRIRTIISGGNNSTESVLPRSWGFNNLDEVHLRAVHRRHGRVRLRTFPTISFFDRFVRYPVVGRVRLLRLLDMVPYRKEEAKAAISRAVGWRDYGGKHCESLFTRFFQGYYLPRKFGYDKRRAHLSSLILSGQMGRDAAMRGLEDSPLDPLSAEIDKRFLAKKFELSLAEFERILALAAESHQDYPNSERLYSCGRFVKRAAAYAKRAVGGT